MDAQAPNRLTPLPGYGAGPAHQHRSPLTTTPRPGLDHLALDKAHSLMDARFENMKALVDFTKEYGVYN